LKMVYANIVYDANVSFGGNAHVFQFIRHARKQGHEIWTWPNVEHPDCRILPDRRLAKLLMLRDCDAVLFRIENSVPERIYMMDRIYRFALGSPKFVWEINTVPEYGLLRGKTQEDVDSVIQTLNRYASACDLAICVSDKLAEYVRKIIGVKNVIVVPNGSDPDIFRPDCPVVPRASHFTNYLNVIWIGSAFLDWVDFDLMQKAAGRVWESELRDKIMFHVVGNGMPSMRQMSPNIHYHGAELYEYLPGWLAAMDVGLVLYKPGQSDYGSPLKMYDYLASGLAVIATEQPQAVAVLSELDQRDSVVKQGDAESLISLLDLFLENPDLLEKYKKASRAIAVEKYNWSRTVHSVFEAIHQA